VLLSEQLDEPPILSIEIALYLQHDSVFEEEVRRVTPRNQEVKASALITPIDFPGQVTGYSTLKARTKSVCLALAVLMESSGH
jgi:hypothetical protein